MNRRRFLTLTAAATLCPLSAGATDWRRGS